MLPLVSTVLLDNGNGNKIRVKRVLTDFQGNQVAPAELEAHLLTHPAVSDCAVIQVSRPPSTIHLA